MYKYLLAFVFLNLFFSNCSKQNDSTNNSPAQNLPPAYFAVTGIGNFSLLEAQNIDMPVSIYMTDTSIKDYVRISVENLPKDVEYTVDRDGDFPPYTATISFLISKYVHAGIYQSYFVLSGKSGAIKKYPVKITLKRPSDIAHRLLGSYQAENTCKNTGTGSVVEIDPEDTAPVKTKIQFNYLFSNSFKGTIDSIHKKINIVNQEVAVGETYNAKGTYDETHIYLRGYYYGGKLKDSCFITLTR